MIIKTTEYYKKQSKENDFGKTGILFDLTSKNLTRNMWHFYIEDTSVFALYCKIGHINTDPDPWVKTYSKHFSSKFGSIYGGLQGRVV